MSDPVESGDGIQPKDFKPMAFKAMPSRLGEKLRSRRPRTDLTLDAAAAAAAMSKSYLSEPESQVLDKPSAHKSNTLARMLGVDINDFVDDAAETFGLRTATGR